jgi:hypothetical protein
MNSYYFKFNGLCVNIYNLSHDTFPFNKISSFPQAQVSQAVERRLGEQFQGRGFRRRHSKFCSVLWIRDIMVRVRILGSVSLSSGSGSCYFLP